MVSGGAFNPAVALGIDASSVMGADFKFFGMSGIYTACQLVGAMLASIMFFLVRPKEYNTELNKTMSNLLSEFIGTFYLVLTVGFNVYTGSKCGAWSIAASLMCMIYALGNVSGAHFNPAVTIAILLSGRGKIDAGALGAVLYIVVQILAGVTAACVAMFTCGRAHAFGPVGDSKWGQVAVAEVVFTFVLCFVVLCVATVKK